MGVDVTRKLACLCAALALVAIGCDRTDAKYGDRGVVRLTFSADDIAPVPGGEAAMEMFVIGHSEDQTQLLASAARVDGSIRWTKPLPAAFAATATNGSTAVVTHWEEPRDPDLELLVVGRDAENHLLVADLAADGSLDASYGTNGIARPGLDAGRGRLFATATDAGDLTVVSVDAQRELTRSRLSPDGTLLSRATVQLPIAPVDVRLTDDGAATIFGTEIYATTEFHGATVPTSSDIAVVRLNASWILDAEFGDGDG